MTEEEVLARYAEMQEWFGDKLANFEHHPRQFACQVRLMQYYKERRAHEEAIGNIGNNT